MQMSERLNAVNLVEASTIMSAIIGDAFVNDEIPMNIAVHGTYGVGKSEITNEIRKNIEEQLRREKNNPDIRVELIDIRLGAMDASEVQGVPFVPPGSEEMMFSTPFWWPKDEENLYTILLMDELMNAAIDVQHSAYRIILDRSINNGKKLHDRVAIIAIGNMREDKTGARELVPALANRFPMHLYIDHNRIAEGLLSHAIRSGWDREVIAFLEFSKSDIIGEVIPGEASFARPRTWEGVAKKTMRNDRIRENEHLLTIAVAGAVGSEKASKFMAFRKTRHLLPDWDKLRNDPNYKYDLSKLNSDEATKFNFCVTAAIELLDALREDAKDYVETLTNYLEQLSVEFRVIVIKTLKRDMGTAAKILRYKRLKVIHDSVAKHLPSKY